MKKNRDVHLSPYNKAKIDIMQFYNADIITTSPPSDIEEDLGENDGEWT